MHHRLAVFLSQHDTDHPAFGFGWFEVSNSLFVCIIRRLCVAFPLLPFIESNVAEFTGSRAHDYFSFLIGRLNPQKKSYRVVSIRHKYLATTLNWRSIDRFPMYPFFYIICPDVFSSFSIGHYAPSGAISRLGCITCPDFFTGLSNLQCFLVGKKRAFHFNTPKEGCR